jgi:hypothetical protein
VTLAELRALQTQIGHAADLIELLVAAGLLADAAPFAARGAQERVASLLGTRANGIEAYNRLLWECADDPGVDRPASGDRPGDRAA